MKKRKETEQQNRDFQQRREEKISLYNFGQVSLLAECICDWLFMLMKKGLRVEQIQESLGRCSENEAATTS